eukprot:1144501-Pelagomonas_calceolata.AAC.3
MKIFDLLHINNHSVLINGAKDFQLGILQCHKKKIPPIEVLLRQDARADWILPCWDLCVLAYIETLVLDS